MKWANPARLWHRHFCWFPTTAEGTTVWLDYIWRRQHPLDYVDNGGWPFTVWQYSHDISGKWGEDQIYGPDLKYTTPYVPSPEEIPLGHWQ